MMLQSYIVCIYYLDKLTVESRESDIYSKVGKSTTSGLFFCTMCMFQAPSRTKVFCHVESKHFQDAAVVYHCEFCEKTLHSRNALSTHVSRYHRQESKSRKFT